MNAPKQSLFKGIRKAALAFLIAAILLSMFPYLIPLPKGESVPAKPFEESAFREIEGVDLHYRLWQPDETRGKVILIHGLGGSTFSWRHNIEPLVDAGFMVVAVDLPGFGYSSRQKDLNHSQQARAEIIWQLVEQLDITLDNGAATLPWDLVGHSMGGGTIAAMALQQPTRVESLTFVAGSVYGRSPGIFTTILRFPPAAQWLKVAANYYFLQYDRIEQFLASAYMEDPTADAVKGYLNPLTLPGTLDTLIDIAMSTNKVITEEALKGISVPALLIWGDHDTWVPLESGKQLAENLKDAELVVISNTGHCPMETNSEKYNTIMLTFLSASRETGRNPR